MHSGVRLMVSRDLRPGVEIFTGPGPEQARFLGTKKPLPIGRFSTVRFECDGKQARLLVNGLLQAAIACAQPAPWKAKCPSAWPEARTTS